MKKRSQITVEDFNMGGINGHRVCTLAELNGLLTRLEQAKDLLASLGPHYNCVSVSLNVEYDAVRRMLNARGDY